MGHAFDLIIIQPILNILVSFYKLYLSVGLPSAFGFSIITITLAVRLIMLPLFHKQMDTAAKMQQLKPQLDVLQKKHKGDQKKLQQEQLRLYQEAGINPASGCLLAIVQIPIFIGLYQTLQLFLKLGNDKLLIKTINAKLYSPMLFITQAIDPHFFGLNLTLSPSHANNVFLFSVPVITAGLQYLQNRYTLPGQNVTKNDSEIDKVKEKNQKESAKKEEPSTGEEFQRAMNTQMKYFFPLMIGYFSYSLPLGLSLYWNIFSIFSIIQQIAINKRNAQKAS